MRISVRIPALASFLALFSALSAADPAAAQDDELTVESVADGIFMLTGKGGNIGVSAGADGFLMIDDKFAPFADRIRDALHDHGDGATCRTETGPVIGARAAQAPERPSPSRTYRTLLT